MLAVVPKLVVPRLGVVGAANFGCLVYALGFICAALAPTGPQYVAAIVVCGFGAVAVPALTSIVAGAADRNSKGAVLGGLQTLQELASAAGYPLYGRLLARGLDGDTGIPVGAPYFAAAAFLVLGALQARRLGTIVVYRGVARLSVDPHETPEDVTRSTRTGPASRGVALRRCPPALRRLADLSR